MSEYDVSIICCYTDPAQVELLRASVGETPLSIEWIMLDNTCGAFSSAARALNCGMDAANGRVLVFVHQDVRMEGGAVLIKMFELLEHDDKLIVGVAGTLESNGRHMMTMASLTEGKNRQKTYDTLKAPMEMMTIDECMFAFNADARGALRFDESVFDGWHFYAVDLSLQAHAKNIRVIAIPSGIWHLSGGTRDASWYVYENALRKKYRRDYALINYPCGWMYTSWALYRALRLWRSLRSRRLRRHGA